MKEKINFWDSVVSRFALLFTALLILAILVSGYLVYQQAAEVITSHSQERLKFTSNLAVKSFNSLLGEVGNDIAVTTNNPVISRFIEGPQPLDKQEVETLFYAVLENKPQYYQIRLLDAVSGIETIRMDKQNQIIAKVPENRLQNKGNRTYYKEALKIPLGNYYYSKINLNEEYGAVSYPLTPTLRAVGHVTDHQGVLRALLVINVDLAGFYQELRQIMEQEIGLMVVNETGDYLFAADMSKCFGDQLGTESSFSDDFGLTVEAMLSRESVGFIQDKLGTSYLYYLEPIHYSPGQQIYLINLLEDNLLFHSAHLVRNDSLKLVLLVCLLSTIIAFLFARVFSENIQRITQAISSYDDGSNQPAHSDLPANRKDELGVLSRTFARMRNRIDQQLKELKIALGREKKAIKDRDEFLQNMSHEIRTPLNAILGLTRLLYKNNPSREQKPIIDSIQRSATNLSGLMYDILDHQKLKEGKVVIDLSPHNFSGLLNEIYASYQYEAVNKGLDFTLEVDDSLKDTSYLTDDLRFNQILTNLVINAIKYTDVGKIKITARIIEGDPGQLQVVVQDTGKGIQPENLKKIRDRFYRESHGDYTTGEGEGYGLGLSIVIQLVELFGGRMEVTSNLDRGSQFSIFLPLIPVDNVAKNIDSAIPADYGLPRLKGTYQVLYLEDDPSTQYMVSHVLEIPGITLHQAQTIEQARTLLQSDNINLIISDLMLNNQLVDTSIFTSDRDIPLIVASAFESASVETISPFFLQKPFDLDKVVNLVIMLLGRNEYDIPKLSDVYKQYDENPFKIRKFLTILEEEFNIYLARLIRAFETKDLAEWTAIMHKLTTHIKSLQLEKLSQLIPPHPSDLDQATIDDIQNGLLYCQCCFRFERQVYARNQN